MTWKLYGGSALDGDGGIYLPSPCTVVDTCQGMWWRVRRVQTAGSATLCALENDGKYWRRRDKVWTGVYTKISDGSVVKECASDGLYDAISGVVPVCDSTGGGTWECDPPAECSISPGCNYASTTSETYVDEITPEDAAEAAEEEAEEYTDGWSAWQRGFPSVGVGGAYDSRSGRSANFWKYRVEMEFDGLFMPFRLGWKERVTPNGGGAAVDTVHFREVELPDPITISWEPETNKLLSIVSESLYLPYEA